MLVVLCKQSDKIFILNNRTKLSQNVFVDGNASKKINAKTETYICSQNEKYKGKVKL